MIDQSVNFTISGERPGTKNSSISVRETTASPLSRASPRLLSLDGETKGQSYRFHAEHPEENRILDLDSRLRSNNRIRARNVLIVGILPDIRYLEPADSSKNKASFRTSRDLRAGFRFLRKEDDAFAGCDASFERKGGSRVEGIGLRHEGG